MSYHILSNDWDLSYPTTKIFPHPYIYFQLSTKIPICNKIQNPFENFQLFLCGLSYSFWCENLSSYVLQPPSSYTLRVLSNLHTKSCASTILFLFTLPPLYILTYFLSFQFPTVLCLKYKPKPKQNKTKSLTKPISSLSHISVPSPFLPNRNPSFLSSFFFFFLMLSLPSW